MLYSWGERQYLQPPSWRLLAWNNTDNPAGQSVSLLLPPPPFFLPTRGVEGDGKKKKKTVNSLIILVLFLLLLFEKENSILVKKKNKNNGWGIRREPLSTAKSVESTVARKTRAQKEQGRETKTKQRVLNLFLMLMMMMCVAPGSRIIIKKERRPPLFLSLSSTSVFFHFIFIGHTRKSAINV